MLGLLAPIAVAAMLAGDPVPRLGFVRTVPAPHDLGQAETIAIVYKLGDTKQLETFLDAFVERVNDSHFVFASDSTGHAQHVIGDGTDPDTERHVRRDHSADAYAGIKEFSCGVQERSGERSSHDADGVRVKKKQVWADAVCHARVDLIDGTTLRRFASFYVRGDGASSRVDVLSAEERDGALGEAARRAAVAAAAQITPRRVRESVELDPDCPDFDRAYAMIVAQRLGDARLIWERALQKHAASAPLHYNLALLCDALADPAGAQKHFTQARRLAPASDRYRRALDAFQKRIQPKKNAPPVR